MSMNFVLQTALLLAGLTVGIRAPAQSLLVQIDTDKENAIYTKGEDIRFSALVLENGKPAADRDLVYTLTADGAPTTTGRVKSAQAPWVISAKAGPVPGWVRLELKVVDEKGQTKAQALAGAMVDPDKIKPGGEEPPDFDAFWAKQKEALAKVPMNPKIKPVAVPDDLKGRVEAFDVRLECGGSNVVYGYLAQPVGAKKGSLPAIVQFHGGSVVGLRGPALHYGDCALGFAMAPHSAENGHDAAYYTNFQQNVIKGYTRRGADDKDTYYFKGMYQRVLRAVEFVKTRPEWNGKVLIVHGESQGGAQSLVAAALDPDVSHCICMVPAMSDHLGYKAGRRSGWPGLVKTEDGIEIDDLNKRIAGAAPYYDNVNFAKRVKAPIWISAGLLDTTCPPSTVYAVYNSLPASTEKHLYTDPKKGHGAGHPGALEPLRTFLGKE